MIGDMRKYLRICSLVLVWVCFFAVGAFAQSAFPITAMDTHLFRQEQRVTTRVQLSADGTLHATMVLENGRKLWGFCAVSYFALQDKEGNVLEIHSIPQACVGEPQKEIIRKVVTWKGKMNRLDDLSRAEGIRIKTFQATLESTDEPRSLQEMFE